MYKRITLFTFICLLALAGIAQNKDTYTILLSGASFAEPNNKWFEMGCRALHAIPINRAVSAESIAHTANKMLDGTLYTPEEFDNIDVFVLMQVHEKDVYNEANLKENYKDYKTPFDASDYAVCYDYVIKRYISDCYNQKFNPKSRYYFVKMRIENESVESREIVLSDLYLIQTNRAKSYAVTTDNIIYFDKTQYVENPDRLSWFTWYTMKPKEVLECVIGYEIDEHSLYDLHEERLMYIGTISVEMLDSWVNPVLSKTVVPLYDLMGNESE